MSARLKLPSKWVWVLSLLACAGCGHPVVKDVDASSGRSANEWIRLLPDDVDWSVWPRPLDRTQWDPVPRGQQLQAESFLQATACVALSDEQLAMLPPGKKSAGMPFLVRAISATWNTDRFEITMSNNGDLWVGGAALSRRTVPIERRAIVVWLNRAPREVYVTFGVYE
jgi:hypothetical protein